jgi:hypothetical protein
MASIPIRGTPSNLAEEGSEGQLADSLDIQAVVLDQLHVQVTSELVRHITEIYELFLDTQTTPQPFRYAPSCLPSYIRRKRVAFVDTVTSFTHHFVA